MCFAWTNAHAACYTCQLIKLWIFAPWVHTMFHYQSSWFRLLSLNTAFNTVDYDILLHCLEHWVDLPGPCVAPGLHFTYKPGYSISLYTRSTQLHMLANICISIRVQKNAHEGMICLCVCACVPLSFSWNASLSISDTDAAGIIVLFVNQVFRTNSRLSVRRYTCVCLCLFNSAKLYKSNNVQTFCPNQISVSQMLNVQSFLNVCRPYVVDGLSFCFHMLSCLLPSQTILWVLYISEVCDLKPAVNLTIS